MSDKICSSIVHYICPICCKETNSQVIMNTKLTKSNAEKVKDLHNKVIGFSNKPCEECQKIIDEKNVFMIVGIDESKTDNTSNQYRTGHIIGINKDSDFYKSLNENITKGFMAYMDIKVMEELKLINNE